MLGLLRHFEHKGCGVWKTPVVLPAKAPSLHSLVAPAGWDGRDVGGRGAHQLMITKCIYIVYANQLGRDEGCLSRLVP